MLVYPEWCPQGYLFLSKSIQNALLSGALKDPFETITPGPLTALSGAMLVTEPAFCVNLWQVFRPFVHKHFRLSAMFLGGVR